VKLVGFLIDERLLRLNCFNKGKQSAMSKRLLLSSQIQEQVREVKVVIFWEKARNPFVGKVRLLVIARDVSFFSGKREIKRRMLST
jgi:hypothetical protein